MIITPESERQSLSTLLQRCAEAMTHAAGQVRTSDLQTELNALVAACSGTVTLLEPVSEPEPCCKVQKPKAKAPTKKARKK